MADEVNFVSHLLTYEEAMKRVWGSEQDVLRFAWAVFLQTEEIEATLVSQTEPHDQHEEDTEGTS
jgi:hypothetical protein